MIPYLTVDGKSDNPFRIQSLLCGKNYAGKYQESSFQNRILKLLTFMLINRIYLLRAINMINCEKFRNPRDLMYPISGGISGLA